MAGTLCGVLMLGLIQTLITFDGSLSAWWTKIVIGALLLAFCLLQRLTQRGAPGPSRPDQARGCRRKNRSISALASGPRGSVYEPAGSPPDQAWPAPWIVHCSARSAPCAST